MVSVKPPRVGFFVFNMENTFTTKKELLKIFPEAKGFLEQDLMKKLEKRDEQTKEYTEAFDRISKLENQEERDLCETFVDVFIGEELEKTEKRIKEINRYLATDNQTKGSITDEMIERARHYPFRELIEANEKGFAKCPFHEDKTPSFYIKKNFYHCFSCQENGDTIDYLMKTEGATFIQAVKRLQ